MKKVTLGRTGVEVSVAGLGCGGFSRLGMGSGQDEASSIAVVQRALELGVNYVDTAPGYGTEEIVGKALIGHRSDVVLSTKAAPRDHDGLIGAAKLRASVEESLRRLRTDVIDVLYLHGVADHEYDHCVDELLPELLDLRSAGHIRFPGISEAFSADPGHQMMQRAIKHDVWDVAMVGFNLLNPSARYRVFPAAIQKGVGVTIMYAVRHALSNPPELREIVASLVADGHVDAADIDTEDPLGFLLAQGCATSVMDAAYRFCQHEPGCDVVLTGTGNLDHLAANIKSINSGPLREADEARLKQLFGAIDHVTAGGRSPRHKNPR